MAPFVIFVALLVGAVVFFVVGYNRLVRLRNNAQSAAADVEVQLQRRHDLLPNLASAVGGYAGHERATLDEVTQSRAAGLAGRSATAGILADAEDYPNLHAEEGFTQFQGQLAGTEQGVAIARQAYNDAVQQYNTAIQTFPLAFVAWFGSFTPMDFMHADDAAVAAVPSVDFAASGPRA
jgi:LemA protein